MPGFDAVTLLLMVLNGLVTASTLFIVASGLSIIFGVSRIGNFAHGSFYMLGAYVAYTIGAALPNTLGNFAIAVIGAALAVGAIGAVLEILILRRLYAAPELMQLVATFALVWIFQDIVLHLWGPEELLGSRVPGLGGSIEILGRRFPQYNLLIILLAPAILAALLLVFHRTKWGALVRAATQDREMVEALGNDQRWLFTTVFFLGSVLAGLAGALQMPREGANLGMDISMVIEAFVVVVIGGMGSIIGCFIAAIIVGIFLSFGTLVIPKAAIVIVFAVMAVTLILRPHGIMGKRDYIVRTAGVAIENVLRPLGGQQKLLALLAVAGVALMPAVLNEFAIVALTEILIYVLFACSLHFLVGTGGLVSFGHAAYFGLGAYAAALLQKHYGVGLIPAIAAAPVAGALGALVFGWFCVRLTGVYFAMLTLAFAQIVWAVVYQWYSLTGGDTGLLGIWPPPWASNRIVFFYITLAVTGAGIWMLRWIVFSPFGFGLRAARDAPLRCEAIGINGRRQQLFGFVVAGGFAGLAGGMMAFLKGSVFPNDAGISMSVDGLMMTILGGFQSLTGPIVGAGVYRALQTWLQLHTELWRSLVGSFIIVLILLAPNGLAGLFQELRKVVMRTPKP